MISNKKLFIQELKRITWAIVVMFLGMIFMKPVLLLVDYENNSRYSMGVALIMNMERSIINHYNADMIVVYASAILLALVGFSYVFSKSKVDMYHSIPVTRRRRFFINYAVGFISFFVLYTIATLFNVLVAAANHFLTVEAVKNFILVYAGNVVHFIYSYSLAIAAVMLTGNIVVCFAAIGTLELYYCFLTELINMYMNRFFITKASNRDIGKPFWNKIPCITPFTSTMYYSNKLTASYNYYQTKPFSSHLHAAGYLFIAFIFAILVLFAAYYLYEKRASEAAGKALSFKASQPIIRIPFVILAGLFAGYMMLSFTGSYESKWLWIGAVAGVILLHCTMEIIFNLNFKALFNDKVQLAASLVVTVIIIVMFDKDLIGYDTYLPDRDKIEAATVVFSNLDTDLGFNEYARDGKDTWTTTYFGVNDWTLDRPFTDDGMIDDIYELSKIGVSCVDDMKQAKQEGYRGREYYMKQSYDYLNNYEMAAGEVIGNVDGPTSVFIAGITDEESEETISGVFNWEDGPVSVLAKGKAAKLELAKEYMKEKGIVVKDPDDNSDRVTQIIVYYRLKNNSVILRRYDISLTKLEASLDKVFSREEYKKMHYNIFEVMAQEDVPVYKVEVYDTLHDRKMMLDYDAAKEFLEIYMEELKTLTVADLKQTPVGNIVPLVKTGEFFDDQLSGYFIYPRFEKTLNFMKDIGVDMEFFTTDVDPKKLTDMTVYPYRLFEYDTDEMDEDGIYRDRSVNMDMATYSTEEPEDMALIESVAPYLNITSYGYSNGMLSQYDNRYEINVYYNTGSSMLKSHLCQIRANEMPKELMEDLIIKMFESQTKDEDSMSGGYPAFQEYDPGALEPRTVGF